MLFIGKSPFGLSVVPHSVAADIIKMPEGVYVMKGIQVFKHARKISFVRFIRGLEIIIFRIIRIHIVYHMDRAYHKVKVVF